MQAEIIKDFRLSVSESWNIQLVWVAGPKWVYLLPRDIFKNFDGYLILVHIFKNSGSYLISVQITSILRKI